MLNSHFNRHLGCVAAMYKLKFKPHFKCSTDESFFNNIKWIKVTHGGVLGIQFRTICKYLIDFSQEMSVLVAAQPESFTPDLR